MDHVRKKILITIHHCACLLIKMFVQYVLKIKKIDSFERGKWSFVIDLYKFISKTMCLIHSVNVDIMCFINCNIEIYTTDLKHDFQKNNASVKSDHTESNLFPYIIRKSIIIVTTHDCIFKYVNLFL